MPTWSQIHPKPSVRTSAFGHGQAERSGGWTWATFAQRIADTPPRQPPQRTTFNNYCKKQKFCIFWRILEAWLARMAPVSTGVKNYAFGLLPPEELPLPQYAAATCVAHFLCTSWICALGANAESLVEALDQAGI